MEEQIQSIWAAYDANGDGLLDRDEATTFYETFIQKDDRFKDKVAPFDDWFKEIDSDADGQITKDEMAGYLNKMLA